MFNLNLGNYKKQLILFEDVYILLIIIKIVTDHNYIFTFNFIFALKNQVSFMSRYLVLLFLTINCFSQSNSFGVRNEKLFWENVYISNESNIPQLIKRHSKLKIDSVSSTIYRGHATSLKNTCDGASTLLDAEFNFNFEIEIREGKYRVTITKLTFVGKKNKSKNITVESELYFVENGAVKSSAGKDLNCLENYFNRIFSFTTLYKSKS